MDLILELLSILSSADQPEYSSRVFRMRISGRDNDDNKHDQGCNGAYVPDELDRIILHSTQDHDARDDADGSHCYLQIEQVSLIRQFQPAERASLILPYTAVRKTRAVRVEADVQHYKEQNVCNDRNNTYQHPLFLPLVKPM